MSGRNDDDTPATYASPPCLMHELDPDFAGLVHTVDPRQHEDVMRWRKGERQRLIADRLALDVSLRSEYSRRIAAHLREIVGDVRDVTVSAYWPFRGEPDLRDLMATISADGGRCALPVVVERHRPLVFRQWSPGQPLERGVWNIPVPAEGAGVIPDVVIAPVVGFDPRCYRLGYGGGFFDRTLAALPARPRVLGVGYSGAAIPTIYPQPHDIAMDLIVTEDGVTSPTNV
jgi:5,10-methenyltetrahydrofolate synthetase